MLINSNSTRTKIHYAMHSSIKRQFTSTNFTVQWSFLSANGKLLHGSKKAKSVIPNHNIFFWRISNISQMAWHLMIIVTQISFCSTFCSFWDAPKYGSGWGTCHQWNFRSTHTIALCNSMNRVALLKWTKFTTFSQKTI